MPEYLLPTAYFFMVHPETTTWETDQRPLLSRLTLLVVAVGLFWRCGRYLLQFPVWGDEAMLCLNLLNHDYWGLTRELEYGQIAPIGYLWSELTAIKLLGNSELALRLLPFLSGLGSLFLFCHLARRTLPPLASTLAIGILAVSIWPISMSTQAKPYAFDLFWALVLLVPAVRWLQAPHECRWLTLLAALVGLAVFCSYPAVFIAGAVSLALFSAIWQTWRAGRGNASIRTLALFALYNAILIGAFLGQYLLVSKNHLATTNSTMPTAITMDTYWAEAFPPLSAQLPEWLFRAFAGDMLAFPLGAAAGGSILTFTLCLTGAWTLWRGGKFPTCPVGTSSDSHGFAVTRRRQLVLLLLAPFALALVAATLRRYPFGSARLSQHLAPSIVLLAGVGLATLIQRAASDARRWRWTLACCGLLLLLGLGGFTRDVLRPGRDPGVVWARQVIRDLFANAGDDPIVIVNRNGDCDAVLLWYLRRHEENVIWDSQLAAARLGQATSIWCLSYRDQTARLRDWHRHLEKHHWSLLQQLDYTHVADPNQQLFHKIFPTTRKPHIEHCDMFHWVRQ